jgi:hypothetical protein
MQSSGTARSLERLNGEVMSIAIFATIVTLTIAQLVFWETLGGTLGFAASVSVLGLSASLSLILAAYVAATHAFGQDYSGNPLSQPKIEEVHDASS